MKQTVLYNGKIYLERARFAQAVLIEDGVFRMVGSNDEVRALAGPSCTFIDCEGRTVVPGLNDSHMHLLMVGEGLAQVNISDCASVEEMVRRCRDFMRARMAPVSPPVSAKVPARMTLPSCCAALCR